MRRRSPRLNASVSLLSLPAEVCTHVLRQLASTDAKAVGALQKSCTAWRAFVDDESFWRSMCEQFYTQPTKMLRAAGKLPSYRVFFVQQATGKLSTFRPMEERNFGDLHWTVEVFVAPYAWGPGAVHPPAVALTRNIAALPANGKLMLDSDALGHVRLCTTEQFLKKDGGPDSDYKLFFWTRWTVRRADGKATCVYDDMPDAEHFNFDRGRFFTDQAVVECAAFAENQNCERWYRDETHGFAHVYPDGLLTLACENGWIEARGVGLQFLLDDEHGMIEHSAGEQTILDMLNDFEWA